MGNLQIKDIDESLHGRLRERAAAERMTMRDYVLRLLERDLARPSVNEWLDEVMALPLTDGGNVDTVGIIRRGREERTDQILAAEGRSTYDDGR